MESSSSACANAGALKNILAYKHREELALGAVMTENERKHKLETCENCVVLYTVYCMLYAVYCMLYDVCCILCTGLLYICYSHVPAVVCNQFVFYLLLKSYFNP